ncbi:MAG: hypothetical protein ACLFUJ_04905 [Phycisphaerae bacterium]
MSSLEESRQWMAQRGVGINWNGFGRVFVHMARWLVLIGALLQFWTLLWIVLKVRQWTWGAGLTILTILGQVIILLATFFVFGWALQWHEARQPGTDF